MDARSGLFDRLKFLDAAIKKPDLIDIGIAPSDHNGAANLLRKGLGIVAFNILEDFIKNNNPKKNHRDRSKFSKEICYPADR